MWSAPQSMPTMRGQVCIVLTASMGCTMGSLISGPIASMVAEEGAEGEAESDITVIIVASVPISWLPPGALPSTDQPEPS